MQRDEPNSLRASMAPIRVAMDIPEQAQQREDETGLEGPDPYEDSPHGQAA